VSGNSVVPIDVTERLASALERLADRLDPNPAMVARIADLEELLKDFVMLMGNADSTNDDWVELLTDVQGALDES
jgi:hypothetical protein